MVSEDDLQDIAELLKEITEEEMRVEVVPWNESITVAMEDLYTDLTLEQIENTHTGPEREVINDYRELFEKERSDSLRKGKGLQVGNG